MGLLDLPIARRVRRNHAIEHATIHILAADRPDTPLAGRSDREGFYLYGDVDIDALRAAATEAIERLKTEPELAVHPRCGTNLVVNGMVAGLAALAAIGLVPEKRRGSALELLPRLMLAGTAATFFSQPLGPKVQERYTTLPDTEGASVAGVELVKRHGRRAVHRVRITEEQDTPEA